MNSSSQNPPGPIQHNGGDPTATRAGSNVGKPKAPASTVKASKARRVGIIQRDASPSQKGPRLQRLRAGHFIFGAIADSTVRHCYAAIEVDGDASVRAARPEGSDSYSEEDKAYAASSALSFVSDAVLNTMVIFADQWLDSGSAKNVRFGFFTPANVAAEITSERTKRLGITPPQAGMLRQLADGETRDAELVQCVEALVLDEYVAQYKDHEPKGHYAKIEAWSDKDWSTFLSLIKWQFSAPDPQECENTLLEDVKDCKFYKPCHQGREDYIVAKLVDLLDSKQHLGDPLDRRVSDSDVENIFLKLQYEPDIRPTDATWRAWERLPAP